MRIWIEWVDSEANPSDPLSRAGWSDSWLQQRDVRRLVVRRPPYEMLLQCPLLYLFDTIKIHLLNSVGGKSRYC
eukprot:3490858-Karenia_brevis.AAC.1